MIRNRQRPNASQVHPKSEYFVFRLYGLLFCHDRNQIDVVKKQLHRTIFG